MKTKWKKLLSAAVSLMFCIAAVVVPLPKSYVLASVTAKTTDYLNLREGAGLDKQVILTLTKGVQVTILDNSNQSWAKVRTESGKEGYCHKDYLIITNTVSNKTAPINPEDNEVTAVTTANVNMRQGAGASNKIITTFNKGTTLNVLMGKDSAWVKVVSPDGRQGYCSSDYLDISSGSETPTPTTPTTPKTPDEIEPQKAVTTATTTDYLNMREGPGLNYNVLITLTRCFT